VPDPLGWIQFLRNIWTSRPRLEVTIVGGECFYARNDGSDWFYCDSSDSDPVLFALIRFRIFNTSTRGNAILDIRLHFSPYTEIRPISCAVGNRRRMPPLNLGPDSAATFSVFFELVGREFARSQDWQVVADPTWRLTIESARAAFALPRQQFYRPFTHYIDNPGALRSYDDPPVTAELERW
jgi:hypothetical protein